MKNILCSISVAFILVCGLAAASDAQTRRGNIDARERHQQQRIAEGIENGSLTPREAARLEREEAEVRRLEARLRESGERLTPRERARLERELNEASRMIYREKHDADRRRL